MAGKVSKTNVAARREQRESANKTCRHCGNEVEMALVVGGRGRTRMVRMCCQKAGLSGEEEAAG